MTTTVEQFTTEMITGTLITPEYEDLVSDLTPLEVKLRNLALVGITAVGFSGILGAVPCGGQQLYVYAPHGYFFARPSTSGLIESPTILESLAALQGSLNRFRTFKEDWDEDGAEAFSPETLESAHQVVTYTYEAVLRSDFVATAPMVSPGTDGRISFAWRLGSKELWIYVQGKTADVYRWEPAYQFDSQPFEQIAVADVQEHIDWLLS
jgi:hypothetical protein